MDGAIQYPPVRVFGKVSIDEIKQNNNVLDTTRLGSSQRLDIRS